MWNVDDKFDSEHIDARNRWGQTRLFRAAETGDMQSVKSLVGEGADISLIDNEKATARIAAKGNGYKEVEEYLYALEEECGTSPEILAEKARLAFEASEAVKTLQALKEVALAEQQRKEKERAQEEKAVWFYSKDLEAREGPISLMDMRKLLEEGRIGKDTLIWSPDINDWKPLHEVIEKGSRISAVTSKRKVISTRHTENKSQEQRKPLTSSVTTTGIKQNIDAVDLEKNKGFFSKLISGDYGLAKTYWLFGVLVGVIANILVNVVSSVPGLTVFLLVYTAYEIPVLIGIWAAANKYNGSKVWAILAKIATVLGWFFLMFGGLSVLGLVRA